MRIGIVNDLRLAVESLRRSVGMIPGASVAWIAEDGSTAVARCAQDRPDIVLMDMIMPVMDGVEATRRIMRDTPCPILVVTATVEGNAGKVFEALGAGAIDAVATPGLAADGSVVNAEPLVRKINTIGLLTGGGANRGPDRAPAANPAVGGQRRLGPIVALGASTGGPHALAILLRSFPIPVPWPVVIIQHIDSTFASGLAEWLTRETRHKVETATTSDVPAPGTILLARTDDHLAVDSGGRLAYLHEPRDVVYRPSVDVFFQSLLANGAAPGAAALLTGMGRDGAAGLARLRAAGWFTVAQDKATSVVWGMPGAAVELGAAAKTLPIQAIGTELATEMATRTTSVRRSA
jgi:chemotaxis response regulator CheB